MARQPLKRKTYDSDHIEVFSQPIHVHNPDYIHSPIGEKIVLRGVTTNNLKGIDIDLPKNQIITVTGVSGSGKSSFAFDTLYKEGQFRYIESLSSYLRQFFNLGAKPEIEYSSGLSPAVAIEQNKRVGNVRSSVGTLTEIDDYLRLLYAKVGDAYCYSCGEPIRAQSVEGIMKQIYDQHRDEKIYILQEIGNYDSLKEFQKFIKRNRTRMDRSEGYTRYLTLLEDNSIVEYFYLESPTIPDKFFPIKVYGIFDRITVSDENHDRMREDIVKLLNEGTKFGIYQTLEGATVDDGASMKIGKDVYDSSQTITRYTDKIFCPHCNITYPEFTTQHFSPNRAEGACPTCHGIGETLDVDLTAVIDTASPYMEAIIPWKDSSLGQQILAKLAQKYGINDKLRWSDLPEYFIQVVVDGDGEQLRISQGGKFVTITYRGLNDILTSQYNKGVLGVDFQSMFNLKPCETCHGDRLRPESLNVFLELASPNTVIAKNETKGSDAAIQKIILSNLKTQEQYNKRYSETKYNKLETKIYDSKNQYLYYFGHKHTTNENDPQNKKVEKFFREFVTKSTNQKIVIVESVQDGVHPFTELNDIIQKTGFSDPNYLISLANQNSIKCVGGEPSNQELFDYFTSKGFEGECINYFFAIRSLIWKDHFKPEQELNERFNEQLQLSSKVTKQEITSTHKKLFDTIFDQHDRDFFIKLIDPTTPNNFSIINQISEQESIFRDLIISTKIIDYYQQGYDIFVGYGRGHLVFQMDLLESLFSGKLNLTGHTKSDVPAALPNSSELSLSSARYNLAQLQKLPIRDLVYFLETYKETTTKPIQLIDRILGPLLERSQTIQNLGLAYINLARSMDTLSGGEIQRLRLAKQLGNKLTGIMYVLDEPTIGLDDDEIQRVITAIRSLKDMGNTIVVVEHNEEFIQSSDWVVEIGPGAGDFGGELVFSGPYPEFVQTNTLTAQYVTGRKEVKIKFDHIPTGYRLAIHGAHEHNLKHIDTAVRLGSFTIITGPSGAGKTTLMYHTLYKFLEDRQKYVQGYIRLAMMQKGIAWKDILTSTAVRKEEYAEMEEKAMDKFMEEIKVTDITGYDTVSNVIYVDQSSIGKTPRSCPATFIGVFDNIRKMFAGTQDAKVLGFTDSYFSFNSDKGACPECDGYGIKKVELQFLPDTYVPCTLCKGKRYKSEILTVRWHGKTINEILEMYVHEAHDFFSEIGFIEEELKIMVDIGLGYIKLGQAAHTLSGGESQRLKLVKHLLKQYKGHSIYFLDEPTVGLHPEDIQKLLYVLKHFLDRGDTILMIEHDKSLLQFADDVIRLKDGAVVK